MSVRQFFKTEGINELGVGQFVFSFMTNGTGAIDQTTIRGRYVTSVTRTAAGTYTVVLDGAFFQTIAGEANVLEAPGVTTPVRAGASIRIPDETANPYSLVVYTYAVGSATPVDLGTGATDTVAKRVCVRLTFKTTQGS